MTFVCTDSSVPESGSERSHATFNCDCGASDSFVDGTHARRNALASVRARYAARAEKRQAKKPDQAQILITDRRS